MELHWRRYSISFRIIRLNCPCNIENETPLFLSITTGLLYAASIVYKFCFAIIANERPQEIRGTA